MWKSSPPPVSRKKQISEVPMYLLGSFEVTVTSVSLPPFVSRRGLSNTNQRLSPSLFPLPSPAFLGRFLFAPS